ncbi:MAG: M14 family metallopeptidase [Rhodospirillaceae bacterium]|nr:M14 family metallopeptidase [Rhodospirillaceae bacterium]
MTEARDQFSRTYADARRRFTDAAKGAGLAIDTHINPNGKGPSGEELTTDVVRIGAKDADTVVFASSGTHGVEGFCGSGVQVGWLLNGVYKEVPKGVALVLIHAINPHGFAHERRVNEDNVDLNRNFRDHTTPPPHNAPYAELHEHLIPADWDGPARQAADIAILKYISEKGERTFQAAVSTGQWEYPDGLFFGGKAPTWSNQTWRRLIREHAGTARRIVHLDFHTGLGAYGDCEVIFGPNKVIEADLARARAWWGKVTNTAAAGESVSAAVQGVNPGAIAEEAPNAQVTAVALEYGVVPVMDTLFALRADHWLYSRGGGDISSPLGKAIKKQIRNAFYGETDAWYARIYAKGTEVLQQAFKGLQG